MHSISPLPPVYSHLTFPSFSVFNPADAALDHLITPFDKNCASSPPNALLGSRQSSEDQSLPPAIEFVNSTEVLDAGFEPYFHLLAFKIKPLASPVGEGETRVRVRGYYHNNCNAASLSKAEGLEWYADFPSGYYLPFAASMSEDWRHLSKVEIWAEFGEQALDWEFCMDDVVVSFVPVGSGDDAVVLTSSSTVHDALQERL